LLPNWYEAYIGTDPYNPDTVGDGITDRDELLTTFTNSLDIDSDENGWNDYEDWSGQSQPGADPDNDGVSNQDELAQAPMSAVLTVTQTVSPTV